jgi:8-oxo-dGTP pyrophosphatase MutT (NUDIX family)
MSGTGLENTKITDDMKASISSAFEEAGLDVSYDSEDGNIVNVTISGDGQTFQGTLTATFTSNDHITTTGRVTDLEVNGNKGIILSEEDDLPAVQPREILKI